MFSLNNLKEIFDKKVSYSLRNLTTQIFGFLCLLDLWLIFSSFILVYIIKNPFIYAPLLLFPFLLGAYILFKPSEWETFRYYVSRLVDIIKKNSTEKYLMLMEINISLKKNAKQRNFGYSQKVFEGVRDYFAYILPPLINSKNKKLLEILFQELSKIKNIDNIHELHEEIYLMNKRIIPFQEFKNLKIVYKSLKETKNLLDPFEYLENIRNNDKPKNIFIKTFNFLEGYGIIRFILLFFMILFACWFLDRLGWLGWVVKIWPWK